MACRLKAFFLQIPTLMREQYAKLGGLVAVDRNWANMMVGFCLESVIQIAVLSPQIDTELPTVFRWVSVSCILAFASFFVGKFISSRFPQTAQVLDRVGMLLAVTGFFVAVTVPFPFWFAVTTWLIYVISLVLVVLCHFFDETQA